MIHGLALVAVLALLVAAATGLWFALMWPQYRSQAER